MGGGGLPLEPGAEPADVLCVMQLVIAPGDILNRHDIEADNGWATVQGPEIGPGGPPQDLLFLWPDGEVRRWPSGELPDPHFDEDNRLPGPENPVNLPASTPPVAFQPFPALAPEVGLRDFLAPLADLKMKRKFPVFAHYVYVTGRL